MSAITAKASRKMKKYAVLTREPRCFLGSFDFSWEQRKLGDIADIVGGGTPSTGNQSYWDGDIDWYAPAEIADQIYANSSQKKITGLGYENSSAKMLPPGTVLFTSRAGIGKTAILTRKGCTNQGFQSIVPHRGELDSYFIFSRTEELKRYGELVGAGSTFVEVSGKQMAVMELMMPPTMREQQTIGGFFQQLDHLITLHQRKCANLCSPSQVVFSLLFATSTFSWEQRKLGELDDRVVRKNTNNESTLPLTISAQYGLVDQITYFNNRVASRDVSNYYLVLNGEFAYNKSTSDGYPFGAVKRLDLYEKGVLSTLYIVFAPKKEQQIDSDYLTVFFDTDRWHKGVAERAAEGARNHGLLNISAEDFFDIDLSVPKDIVEQKQIGAFIRQLDNLITLHQRKFEKLTNVKKSMLEKMFPQNGSSYPEIRFKGFTDPWEQRKLGEMGQTYTGLSGKTKDDFGHGQARFVTYMNVFSNPISNPEMTEPIEIDPKQNEVEVGDVFFTTSSETPEEVGMSSILLEKRGKTYLNSFCFGFRPSEKIDSYYLAYMLRSESARAKITLLAQGISRYNISKNKVMEIAVSLPSLDEQKMIGQYFSQLDNLITLHQRKPFLMKWRTSDANRNQTNRLVL